MYAWFFRILAWSLWPGCELETLHTHDPHPHPHPCLCYCCCSPLKVTRSSLKKQHFRSCIPACLPDFWTSRQVFIHGLQVRERENTVSSWNTVVLRKGKESDGKRTFSAFRLLKPCQPQLFKNWRVWVKESDDYLFLWLLSAFFTFTNVHAYILRKQ
jgi:hypothetical protein